MIKWKLYSGDEELIERVTDVTSFRDKDWLEMLEEDKTNLYGLWAQRKLKAKWSIEAATDIKAMHGLDIEEEFIRELSEEIRYEMDREFMKAIMLPPQESKDAKD